MNILGSRIPGYWGVENKLRAALVYQKVDRRPFPAHQKLNVDISRLAPGQKVYCKLCVCVRQLAINSASSNNAHNVYTLRLESTSWFTHTRALARAFTASSRSHFKYPCFSGTYCWTNLEVCIPNLPSMSNGSLYK